MEELETNETNGSVCGEYHILIDTVRTAVVGRDATFYVVTEVPEVKSSMQVNVIGPSINPRHSVLTKVKYYSLREKVFGVTFRPSVTGSHMIAIRWNEEEIEGSPFWCNVTDPPPTDDSSLSRKGSFRRSLRRSVLQKSA